MLKFFKLHLHPLGGRIIFWNFVLLLIVKLVIPHSGYQTASLLGITPPFDSREIIQATNEARTSNNLPSLKPNAQLDFAASEKLNNMATQEYFAHINPDGTTPWYWIQKSNYKYSVAGENLAIGFFTAKDTIKAWLNSPSHKANLLNNRYQDIGVAVKSVEINGREGTLVVQMFGRPATQVAVITQTPVPTPKLGISSPQPISVSVQGEFTTAPEIVTDPQPVIVPILDTEKITSTYGLINNIFSVYAMILVAVTAIAFVMFEKSRGMALKAALNLALFLLAILVPVSQVNFEGLIF